MLVIQHTLVGGEFAAGTALGLRKGKPKCRSASTEAHGQFIVILPASGANETTHCDAQRVMDDTTLSPNTANVALIVWAVRDLCTCRICHSMQFTVFLYSTKFAA